MRCGAKTRHGTGRCGSWPVKGRNRCRMHGGKTPVGTACKHFRSGRYSAYVPARLRARYEQAQADAELLSLRSEVALVDARLAELLSRVDSGESGQLWADLKKAHQEFTVAKRGQDVARMRTALARVEHLIDRAVDDHQAWAEIAELLEQRRRLAESEQKRLVSLQQMMHVEDALLLVRRLSDIITVHIADRKILSAILVDMQQFTGPPHALPADAEGPGA
jgi:hypothetical protein